MSEQTCTKKLADGQWCNAPLGWKEWDNEQGGFWACPNYKNHAPKAQGGRPNGPPAQQGPSRPAGAPNGRPAPSDKDPRSIEAQTAIRGACDVAAAVGPALMARENGDASIVTEFAVTLARRLLREVAYPVTGAPMPEGLSRPRSGWAARGPAPAPQGHPNAPGNEEELPWEQG